MTAYGRCSPFLRHPTALKNQEWTSQTGSTSSIPPSSEPGIDGATPSSMRFGRRASISKLVSPWPWRGRRGPTTGTCWKSRCRSGSACAAGAPAVCRYDPHEGELRRDCPGCLPGPLFACCRRICLQLSRRIGLGSRLLPRILEAAAPFWGGHARLLEIRRRVHVALRRDGARLDFLADSVSHQRAGGWGFWKIRADQGALARPARRRKERISSYLIGAAEALTLAAKSSRKRRKPSSSSRVAASMTPAAASRWPGSSTRLRVSAKSSGSPPTDRV